MNRDRFVLRPLAALLLSTFISSSALSAPAQVYPVRAEGFSQSLNGQWSFKYLPALQAGADDGFYAPQFDVSAWRHIAVPANWELQGFAEPSYDLALKDGLGLYRRSFRVPANWRGRKTMLRFDGVAFGFDLWVNGRPAGASVASAFNPHTFDVTGLLREDGENTLALKVTTKPKGYEFDVNDDWSLSGIFRDVTLFSVPVVHVQDLSTATRLADDGSAALSVSVQLSGHGKLRARLLAPSGRPVKDFDLAPAKGGAYAATVRVPQPRLWTAETPALYRLQLTLSDGGRTLQALDERIGLREVRIADGVLQLNGRPIKLRGVNHHDLEPGTGRTVTDAGMRRDLALMKKANVNYVRTSHYPPDERFLRLCDELGFYVVDEVAIGKGEEHLDKPDYRATVLARVEPTITRDKNHPSVIVWSIGNENPVTEVELEAGRLAKRLDPTRPITIPKIGSYFAKNYQRLPEEVDIYAPHYPTNAAMRDYAKNLKRPVIFTEYAHALGLATDRIQDQWDFIQSQPGFAGGSIWHFHDQGILRTSLEPVDTARPTTQVWTDATHYYDTHGLDGTDGIVYADRTPQADYWQTRKVYAPVQIAERSARVAPGAAQVALTVENRYDFRALAGMRLEWTLQRNGATVRKGSVALAAPSRARETVRIPVTVPKDAGADVFALLLRCLDENGEEIIDRVVRLDLEGASRQDWLAGLPAAAKPSVTEDTHAIRIASPNWTLDVVRASGELTIRDKEGRVLVAGIYPHSGRKPTMAEQLSVKDTKLLTMSTLRKLETPAVTLERPDGALRLSVSGRYPRPDAPAQAFVGGYQVELAPNGSLAISYDFRPTGAEGMLSEAGLSVLVPSSLTEFRWIGQGPWAGYPGKDRLNEFGLFHLNREDLRFQGNRRGTELALLTAAAGNGVALAIPASDGVADVAVERDEGQTLLSHNALIGGLGNKGTRPETRVALDAAQHIAGRFTLLPLAPAWPAALTRLFGQPGTAGEVFRPFLHSYDQ
jgi:beta-galactosidase